MKNIKYLVRFIEKELSPHKAKFFVATVLLILTTLISYVFPKLSIIIIDQILPQKDTVRLINIIIFIAFLYLLSELFTYVHQQLFITIKEKLGIDLQLKVLSIYKNLKYSEFENINDNDKYAYIIRDINNIKKIFDQTIVGVLRDILSFVIGLYFMFELFSEATIIILIVLMILGVLFWIVSKNLRMQEREISYIFGKVLHEAMAPVNKYFSVKIHNIFEFFIKKIKQAQNEYFKKFLSIYRLRLKITSLQKLLANFLVLFVFLFLGLRIIAGNFTLGQLIGYNFFLSLVLASYNNLVTFHLDFQSTMASISRLRKFIELDDEFKSFGTKQIAGAINNLEVVNLSFSYPQKKDKFSIKKINFSLNSGEILGIIGENGSGKSTLIKLLLGIYSEYDGKIKFNNTNIKQYNIFSLRESISFVEQENFFIDSSLKENIILTKNYDEERLDNVIKVCGLKEYISYLDKNINSLIKSKQVFLSGGYQQRIAIARALYKEPKLLILDEATSQLDPDAEMIYKKLIVSIKKSGIPIILITHRMSTIDIADKILILESGKLVDFGEKDIVFASNDIAKKFLENQRIIA